MEGSDTLEKKELDSSNSTGVDSENEQIENRGKKDTVDSSNSTGVDSENGKIENRGKTDTDKNSEETATFKTPAFIIPTKKKIKTDTETSSVFKLPEKRSEKVKTNDIKTEENQESVDDQSLNDKKPEKSTGNVSSLSPAEQLQQAQSAIPYKEPPWGSLCTEKYFFEVIKNGAVIDKVDLSTKSFHVIGRLPSCDIPMEHPSLSRYHAVVQYTDGKTESYPRGWYLYDLDSTHGTWINKNKVPPAKYHKISVDYVFKFGGSTRLFILHGPEDDREEESELSVAQMKEQRDKQIKEAELIRQAEIDEAERKAELLKRKEEEKGCSWGIDEDAEEDEEPEENPFANFTAENERLYIDDPKKSLNGFFEREGYDPPEYEFIETGYGKWKCSVELPVDSPSGEPMKAEVVVSGKKKDAVVACALEACRLLDRMGELRKSTHESRKRKQKNWEDDDFYDSDEDVYLDRTGAIEKKREIRKMKVGKTDKVFDTYDSLLEKHKTVLNELEEIEGKLEKAKAQAAAMESEDIDALDAYMSAIKSGMMDTKTKMKLKRQVMELKQEEQKIRKLINIAKPASLPDLPTRAAGDKQLAVKKGILAGVGKMKGPVHGTKHVKQKISIGDNISGNTDDKIEEEEDDEEEVQSEIPKDNKQHDDSMTDTKVESNISKTVKISEAQKVTVSKQEGNTAKKKGPSLPLAAVLEQLQSEPENMNKDPNNTDNDSYEPNSSSKRKAIGRNGSGKKMKFGVGATYDTSDPDFATWLPPDSQSGDGKTHLNDKYGY